ncbi:MAG: mannonate dehydratase [Planctomycetota bacterium]|nr:mannonate dehydratase [Planctomycetota bacterium]
MPRIHLGTQRGPTTPETLQYFAQFGVEGIVGYPPSTKPDECWKVADLIVLRELVESYGIRLEFLPLPLPSSLISHAQMPNIMLGKSPERDREIDIVCDMIRAAAQAGIPALKYNMTILGVVRSEPTRGRGGSTYSTFVYEKANQDSLTEAGHVDADAMWERITYFLERVIPVAEEHKVKMACHPHDPGMPDEGFRGVDRVLGRVDGMKKFIEICPSEYHGFNFCVGTVSENLKDPANEICDVVRYFSERKKIFMVHLRNIRGSFLNFQEVYPDEGDVNLLKVVRALKETGYDGMLLPDHMPNTVGDQGGKQAFAFGYGYIKALLQAVYEDD